MSESIIYHVEALVPGQQTIKVGIFQRRSTADAWLAHLGEEVTRTITQVHLVDARHNHQMGMGDICIG